MSHKTQLVDRSVLRQVCWQCLGFVANAHSASMVCAQYTYRVGNDGAVFSGRMAIFSSSLHSQKSYQPSAAIYTSSCRSCAALCGFLSAEKTFYVPDPARFEQASRPFDATVPLRTETTRCMHVDQRPGPEKIGMQHANKQQMHIVGKSTYDAQHQYLCASRRKT